MQEKVQISLEDAKELVKLLEKAEWNIGRSIVHGRHNSDSSADIAANVLADVQLLVIHRWIDKFFPGTVPTMNDEDAGFADDDEPDVQAAYADAGYGD